MINIEIESDEMYENFRCYERCVFCKCECPSWDIDTNQPVCTECSEKYDQSDLDKLIKEGESNGRK